jgi:hypothetical protein
MLLGVFYQGCFAVCSIRVDQNLLKNIITRVNILNRLVTSVLRASRCVCCTVLQIPQPKVTVSSDVLKITTSISSHHRPQFWYKERKRIWPIDERPFQQSVSTRSVQKPRNGTLTSYKISLFLLQRKKPSENGELVKETVLSAVEYLFESLGTRQKSCQRLKMSNCSLTQ